MAKTTESLSHSSTSSEANLSGPLQTIEKNVVDILGDLNANKDDVEWETTKKNLKVLRSNMTKVKAQLPLLHQTSSSTEARRLLATTSIEEASKLPSPYQADGDSKSNAGTSDKLKLDEACKVLIEKVIESLKNLHTTLSKASKLSPPATAAGDPKSKDETSDLDKAYNEVTYLIGEFVKLQVYQTNHPLKTIQENVEDVLSYLEKNKDNMDWKTTKRNLKVLRSNMTIVKAKLPSLLETSSYTEALRLLATTSRKKAIKLPSPYQADGIYEKGPFLKEFQDRYGNLGKREKLCLLCFAIFPENAEVSERLLRFWWEGERLRPTSESATKKVNEILDEFVKRGFIEPVYKRSGSKGSCYKMHPIVRCLIVRLAKQANFFYYDSKGYPSMEFFKSSRICLVKSEGPSWWSKDVLAFTKARERAQQGKDQKQAEADTMTKEEKKQKQKQKLEEPERKDMENRGKLETIQNQMQKLEEQHRKEMEKHMQILKEQHRKQMEKQMQILKEQQRKQMEKQLQKLEEREKDMENRGKLETTQKQMQKLQEHRKHMEKQMQILKEEQRKQMEEQMQKLEEQQRKQIKKLEKQLRKQMEKQMQKLKEQLRKQMETERINYLENLQTLFNVSKQFPELPEELFPKMKNIHVLYLGRWERTAERHMEVEDVDFLKGLKNMNKLRFFSLHGISGIKKLPDSIGMLQNLRILDLKACHTLEALPKEVGQLKMLSYLDLSECYFLDRIPTHLSKLSKLKVLKGFVISSNSPCNLTHLTTLSELEKLSISIHDDKFSIKEEESIKQFSKFNKLTKLKIAWGAGGTKKSLDKAKHPEDKNKTSEASKLWPTAPEKGNVAVAATTAKAGQDKNGDNAKTQKSEFKLEKLDIRCYPDKEPPKWLVPKTLTCLKRLYFSNGEVSHIPVANRDEKWKVEFLRLKYLINIKMDWKQIQKQFPELKLLEKVNCPQITFCPCDASGVWEVKQGGTKIRMDAQPS